MSVGPRLYKIPKIAKKRQKLAGLVLVAILYQDVEDVLGVWSSGRVVWLGLGWGCHLDWRICRWRDRCVRWWCDFGEANRVFNKSGFRLSSFILAGSRGELLLCRGRDFLAGRVFRLFKTGGRWFGLRLAS